MQNIPVLKKCVSCYLYLQILPDFQWLFGSEKLSSDSKLEPFNKLSVLLCQPPVSFFKTKKKWINFNKILITLNMQGRLPNFKSKLPRTNFA